MVGQAHAKVFGIRKIFTRNQDESTITLAEAARCKFVFICLPTPVDKHGEYFVEDIKSIIKQIESYGAGSIYVIRSTVPPGFALGLQREMKIPRIVSNPEFLSETTAYEDTKNPPFVLIGGYEGQFVKEVQGLYAARIKAPIIITDNTTAELAKISLNAYFATKVMFANQLHDATQKLNANYSTIKHILESHPYGPKNHFTIWYKGKRGVHGMCLPKDSKAFAQYAHSELVEKVVELNRLYETLKEND